MTGRVTRRRTFKYGFGMSAADFCAGTEKVWLPIFRFAYESHGSFFGTTGTGCCRGFVWRRRCWSNRTCAKAFICLTKSAGNGQCRFFPSDSNGHAGGHRVCFYRETRLCNRFRHVPAYKASLSTLCGTEAGGLNSGFKCQTCRTRYGKGGGREGRVRGSSRVGPTKHGLTHYGTKRRRVYAKEATASYQNGETFTKVCRNGSEKGGWRCHSYSRFAGVKSTTARYG